VVAKAGLTADQAHALIMAKNYQLSHKREFHDPWYPWQEEFLYSKKPQTMLLAGNRSGKTLTAGYLFATHCTGDYPDDWKGQRFSFGLNALAAGVDAEQLKVVVQRTLFGDLDEDKRFTGGWFHPNEITNIEWSGVVTGLARRVTVKSRYGKSVITLRQYTQSRTGSGTLSFAGTSLDLVWIDECPNDSLVGQLVTRTMTGNRNKGGLILYSMTPELGMTELVASFLEKINRNHQKMIGPISWDECPHLTPSVQEQILSGIPVHEHDMRRKGIPFFGSGLVYPVAENRIKIDPFSLEGFDWFRVIRAIDLGVKHPQATAWLAHDPENDTIYLVKDYSMSGQSAAVHAAATNALWAHSPVVVPHDYDTVEKGTAEAVSRHYYDAGLKNTIPFENIGGGIKVEPGIQSLYDRMVSGRFKAFSTCTNFFREMRMYHRDTQGIRVKENDDVLDCVRQGSMMIGRYGTQIAGRRRKPKVKRAMA